MEEVFTCICGLQDRWLITDNGTIKCVCGRNYLIVIKFASEFNKNREKLLVNQANAPEPPA